MEIRTGSRRKPRRIEKKQEQPMKNTGELVIALAGNPNVGKSTLFNALTGLLSTSATGQEKTVENAQGSCQIGSESCTIIDVPGCYSLMARSAGGRGSQGFSVLRETGRYSGGMRCRLPGTRTEPGSADSGSDETCDCLC